MTTEMLPAALVLQSGPHPADAIWELLTQRILGVMKPLMEASSRQGLRRMVEKSVVDYAPIRSIILDNLTGYARNTRRTTHQVTTELNTDMWDLLISPGGSVFSSTDKKILAEVLRSQAQFSLIADNCPPENKPAVLSALIDGYWSIQKLDLCTSAALAVASGLLTPSRQEIPHWLCLAIKSYLEEWQSVLFVNNPELRRRLLTPPSRTIPLDEVIQRLGL